MDKKEKNRESYKKYSGHELIAFIAVFVIGIFLGSIFSGAPSIVGLATKSGTPVECYDQIDNDGDNRVDIQDNGCSSKKDKSELNPYVQCDDGIDNDGDTKRDSNDGGCSSLLDRSERGSALCDDGKDNDQDGKIDYPNDIGCASESDNNELADTQCDDGIDNNDADTLADYPNDPGCESPLDDSEADGACDDGVDNDADGLKDYLYDPECTSHSGIEGNCYDSDNGLAYEIPGAVSVVAGKIPYTASDKCTLSTILAEYYCDQNGQLKSAYYDCANNNKICSNGACASK